MKSKNPDEVKKRRQEIQDLLENNREDIEAGKLVVYMVDVIWSGEMRVDMFGVIPRNGLRFL